MILYILNYCNESVSTIFRDKLTYLVCDRRIWVLDLELFDKAFVLAPQQSDVRDLIKLHRQAIETEPKRPAHLAARTSCNSGISPLHYRSRKVFKLSMQHCVTGA